ncbi:hypothetical protein Tco_1484873 [Tanacetum coccineum]
MTEFEKNPAVVALQEKIYVISTKVKEHKLNLDMMMLESHKWAGYQQNLSTLESKVVLKVVPYAVIELIHSDDMGSLVGRLVSFAILYGRCRAYKQVADMKEPFKFSKLDEFMADPSDPIEVLLSKKHTSLQRHVPLRTQVPLPTSQRATPSSALVSNPMSPPTDASIAKPQSSPL